jgi:4-amino-4-deoxy-L-arabinose transferase-like glycosyltransferase
MNAADMLAPSEVLVTHWRRPLLRWLDGIEAGWAIPLLLIGSTLVWLAVLTIANFNADLQPDTMQAWSSGRSLEWGYAKHAPLAAWIAHAWTAVFPLTNWSFRLLALTNAALALWVVDLISRRFVQGDRRMVALLLLMLLPIYQFQAARFDADSVLLAAWPIATYCFLRSFESRQIGWAVAAGATAALAMLGSYHSVFLIASFVVAAICHPQRRAYLASPAPVVSTAAGFAALGPHMHWLATTGAKPFADTLGQLAGGASAASLIEALLVVLVLASFVATPLAIWGLMVPGRLRKLSQVVRIIEPGQFLLFLVSVGTIVFPAIIAVGLGIGITKAWEFQGLYLLVILVVCGSSAPIERGHAVNLAALVTAIAVLSVLVAAPLHALYRNYYPSGNGPNFYQLSAAELTRQWHAESAEPLAVVGGDEALALAAAFYSPDHPLVEPELVRLQAENALPESAVERGWASLCIDTDELCVASMETVAARTSRFARSEFTVESNLLGFAGARQHFAALIVQRSAVAPPALAPSSTVAEATSAVTPPSAAQAPSAASWPPVAQAPSVEAFPPVADAMTVGASSSVAGAPAVAASSSAAEAPAVAASSPAEEKATPAPTVNAAEVSPGGQQAKPDDAVPQSEAAPPKVASEDMDKNRGRSEILPLAYRGSGAGAERATAEFKVNWMRWAAAHQGEGCPIGVSGWQNPCCTSCWAAVRSSAARVQLVSSTSAKCASRGRGCSSALPAIEPIASGSSDAPASFSACSRRDPASPRLLASLSQKLCNLAGFFEAHAHSPRQRPPANPSLSRARASMAELQLPRQNDAVILAEQALFVPE